MALSDNGVRETCFLVAIFLLSAWGNHGKLWNWGRQNFMDISYNVGPPFDSQVGAHNSNFTMVYGTQIAN